MRNLLPTLALLTFAVTTHLSAQTEVVVGVMRGKDYGVTYQLPKTEIAISVTLTKHSYTPGDFCRYADKYLRLGKPASDAEEWWTMDKVTTSVVGVPDAEHTYFVKLKDKSTAPLMELTEDGIVRSINIPYSSKSKEAEKPRSEVTPATSLPDPHTYFTEEMLMAGSSAKLAELVAKEIYSIRESKSALNRGEADYMPTDGAQLKLMLENLDTQEQALTSMFMGQTTQETSTVTVRIEPQEMQDEVAFRFSKKLGLLDSDDLAGEPIYISLSNLNTIAPTATYEEEGKKVDGVAYNVPGRAQVSISYGKQQLFSGELPITQFGTTEYLSAVLFNKNTTTQVLFDTATGGLLKVDRAE